MLCDRCARPLARYGRFALITPVADSYRICDDCALVLDRFIAPIDKARQRRVKTATKIIR